MFSSDWRMGDRLTVFEIERFVFRGLDGFSGSDVKTGFRRIGSCWFFHGIGALVRCVVFHRDFPKEEKLIDIGFNRLVFS